MNSSQKCLYIVFRHIYIRVYLFNCFIAQICGKKVQNEMVIVFRLHQSKIVMMITEKEFRGTYD